MNGLGAINLLGIGVFKQLSNLTTLAKLVPLLLFIIAGASFADHSHFFHFDDRKWEMDGFGNACLIIFFAFSGFENLPLIAAEMRNPARNIPIAVFLAISICAGVYVLIQLIAMGILGPELLNSQTPLLDSAEMLYGEPGKIFVGAAMLISIGGINIAASFITPRNAAALAEDNFIPACLANKNKWGSPLYAIYATVAATSFFILTGNFAQLAAISVVCRFVQYLSTCLAVFAFHRIGTINVFDRKWKMAFPLIGITGIGWLLSQTSIWQPGIGGGVLLAGIPVYLLQKLRMPAEEQTAALLT